MNWYKTITSSFNDQDIELFNSSGNVFLEQDNVDGFDLAIIESPMAAFFGMPVHQLALKREEKPASDLMVEDNFKLTFPKEQNWKSIWENVVDKIKEYQRKYGLLSIGSMNQNRAKKYYSKLKNLGFNVEFKEVIMPNGSKYSFCIIKP